jgi:hypothetical protein
MTAVARAEHKRTVARARRMEARTPDQSPAAGPVPVIALEFVSHNAPTGTALPVGTAFSGVDLSPDVAGAGNDFEAIEKLRRLAFADQVEAPQQLLLWQPTNT